MYFIYILKSLNFNKTYTGRTSNIGKRLKKHNQGNSNFSSKFKPWSLIYSEELKTLQDSIKREKFFKSKTGRKWIKENLFNN